MTTHRFRWFVAVVALLTAVAACGDGDDSSEEAAESTTTAEVTTTAAPETTAGSETTAAPETTAASETTAAPETTAASETTAAVTERPSLAITTVDFEAGTVTITNTGDAAVSTDGMVLCQFPTYDGIPTETIEPGATIEVDAGIIGGVSAVSGEAALYLDSSFTSADSMISYVEWGTPDHERAPVAVEAGVWDGQAVDSTDATSISTEGAASAAADWTPA